MLERLLIENFQSIRSADLPLAPITVFVGRGDAGKSATLRALVAALFNDGDDGQIRQGAKEAAVSIEFAGGQTLAWLKAKGKGAVYGLGEQVFTKIGTGVPEEIQAATGFREIAIDTQTSIRPQVHDQFDAPFVIAETGSKIARILGSLTKLSYVVQAQMICKRNGNRHEAESKAAQDELARLEAALDEFPDVDALERKLAAVIELDKLVTKAGELQKRRKGAVVSYAALPSAVSVNTSRARSALSLGEETLATLTALGNKVTAYQGCIETLRVKAGTLKEAKRQLKEAEDALETAHGEVCERCPLRA